VRLGGKLKMERQVQRNCYSRQSTGTGMVNENPFKELKKGITSVAEEIE